jgi:hypothetical protein
VFAVVMYVFYYGVAVGVVVALVLEFRGRHER